MKILLMTPLKWDVKDYFESLSTFPHIGIASIAAFLKEKGHHVCVLDPQIEGYTFKKLIDKIMRIDPDILGITSYTEEINYAGRIIKEIKNNASNIFTVIGGAHASALPEDTLKRFPFDIAVIGEGEETMYEVVEALEKGYSLCNVKGIYFRDNNKIRSTGTRELISDLDSLPFPAWNLFPLEKYKGLNASGFRKKNEFGLPVEGARGCPYSCLFCYRVMGRKVRYKSPKRIADEVQRNIEDFGISSIHFVEGTFAVNKEIAYDTCDELIKRGIHEKIKWGVGGRVDNVDQKLLNKMKEAGCFVIGYGVESGSEEILRKCGKNTTKDQIRKAISETKKAGIIPGACFILGLPYDTEETINETIEFARELDPYNPNFAILVPFPGTQVAEMAKKGEGGLRLLSDDWSDYGKQIGKTLELEGLNQKKLKRLQQKAYLRYYGRPSKVPYLFQGFVSIVMPRIILRLQNMIYK